MPLASTLKFIAGHPFNHGHELSAIGAFVRWQVRSRLTSREAVFDWVDGAKIILHRGETGLSGNLYCGLHEFSEMAYVLHVVGADDLFVDVGANAGSYTVLACAARGARGICVEPVPSTFERLMGNIRINNLEARVEALNIGLSDSDGELLFTTDEDCVNHVVAEGEVADGALSVQVRPLDAVLAGRAPTMLKIDVEGFETSVLRGASACFGQPSLHSVIMELNGSGARYGHDEAPILGLMRDYGFATYAYEPRSRRLQSLEGKNPDGGNTLFIRNREYVMERLARASPSRIMGRDL